MIFLAIICAGLIGLVVWERHQARSERAEWARERSELITRVQHPEIVVGPPEALRPDEEYMTSEQDDIDKVGTIEMSVIDGDG